MKWLLNYYEVMDEENRVVYSFTSLDDLELVDKTTFKNGKKTKETYFTYGTILPKHHLTADLIKVILSEDKNYKTLLKQTLTVDVKDDKPCYSIKISQYDENGELSKPIETVRDSNNLDRSERLILHRIQENMKRIRPIAYDPLKMTKMAKIDENNRVNFPDNRFESLYDQFKSVTNDLKRLMKELMELEPTFKEVVNLTVNNPEFMVIPDTKDKRQTFNPFSNEIQWGIQDKEQPFILLDKNHNSEIKVGKYENEIRIKIPKTLLELNSSKNTEGLIPLDRTDDKIIDAVSSFVVANSDTPIDWSSKNCLRILDSQKPLAIPEKQLLKIVYDTNRPTENQRNDLYERFIKLTTTMYIHHYENQLMEYTGKDEITDEDRRLYQVDVESPMLHAEIYTGKTVNGKEQRVYKILGLPAFLRHAMTIRQIKTIPIEPLIKINTGRNSNDFINIKYQLNKRIQNTLSKLRKQKSKNKNLKEFDLVIRLDTLFNEAGVEFNNSKTRTKKSRLIQRIEKYLNGYIKNSENENNPETKLNGFKFFPDKPRTPKEKILLQFKTADGEIIEAENY